jgi:RNA polymerase sigma-70 factor (ECF subfamily)
MPEDVTLLLNGVRDGGEDAESHLLAIVYAELRQIAAREFRKEHPGHTLQPTALVHEAYLKLFRQYQGEWKDRAHFFAVAAQVMRRILIDHARAALASKRGGAIAPLSLEEGLVIAHDRLEELLVIEDALSRLEQHDARVAHVVTMRFYGGMDLEEISQALKVSSRTIKRDWRYGRAWLKANLGRTTGNGPS